MVKDGLLTGIHIHQVRCGNAGTSADEVCNLLLVVVSVNGRRDALTVPEGEEDDGYGVADVEQGGEDEL